MEWGSLRFIRGTTLDHFGRVCDGRHARTTRIRTAIQAPYRCKDGGRGVVVVVGAVRERVVL